MKLNQLSHTIYNNQIKMDEDLNVRPEKFFNLFFLLVGG